MGARSGFFELPSSVPWQEAYESQMKTAQRAPRGERRTGIREIDDRRPFMTTRRSVIRAMGGAATLGVARAFAQDDKSTVTVLVGAGSTMESTARLISEYLREVLGRPVITVSKLGAGGRLALGELRRSAPDGRTLMFSTSSPFTIYPNVYIKLDYDPVTDFTPITGVSAFDIALATGPGTNATDLKGVLAWAKSKGSEALYGAAPGNGSASHFTGIGMALAANLTLNMVPYKDSAVGIGDVITGRLPLLITGTGAMGEMHKAGKLRIVATSGHERTPLVTRRADVQGVRPRRRGGEHDRSVRPAQAARRDRDAAQHRRAADARAPGDPRQVAAAGNDTAADGARAIRRRIGRRSPALRAPRQGQRLHAGGGELSATQHTAAAERLRRAVIDGQGSELDALLTPDAVFMALGKTVEGRPTCAASCCRMPCASRGARCAGNRRKRSAMPCV